MKVWLPLIALVLLLGAMRSWFQGDPVQDAPRAVAVDPATLLTDEDRVLLCRATAAAMGYHPLEIVSGAIREPGIARVEYRRPSDRTRWVTDCRFTRQRIVWANVEGGQRMRWRDDPRDETIRWVQEGTTLQITQRFPGDSSVLRRNFLDAVIVGAQER